MMTTNEVWKLYSDDIKRYIENKVRDEAITEDILQDTFIKIHTKLHTLKDLNKIKSWCFTIARNSIMDFFRTSKISSELPDLTAEIDTEENFHTEKDCLLGILQNLPKKI